MQAISSNDYGHKLYKVSNDRGSYGKWLFKWLFKWNRHESHDKLTIESLSPWSWWMGWCGERGKVICSTGPHWASLHTSCAALACRRAATSLRWSHRSGSNMKISLKKCTKKKLFLKKKALRNQELKIMRKSTVAPLQCCRLRVESFWLIPRAQNNQLAAVNQCHNCPANKCFCRPVFGEFRRSKLQSDYCPS